MTYIYVLSSYDMENDLPPYFSKIPVKQITPCQIDT